MVTPHGVRNRFRSAARRPQGAFRPDGAPPNGRVHRTAMFGLAWRASVPSLLSPGGACAVHSPQIRPRSRSGSTRLFRASTAVAEKTPTGPGLSRVLPEAEPLPSCRPAQAAGNRVRRNVGRPGAIVPRFVRDSGLPSALVHPGVRISAPAPHGRNRRWRAWLHRAGWKDVSDACGADGYGQSQSALVRDDLYCLVGEPGGFGAPDDTSSDGPDFVHVCFLPKDSIHVP
jgi:hypothetical protein